MTGGGGVPSQKPASVYVPGGLPPIGKPLREARLQTVIVGVPFEEAEVDEAPLRERPQIDVTERIVHARRRVVTQVDVVGVLLAPAAGEYVVRFDRHGRAKLPLHTNRGLMRARPLAPGMIDFARQLPAETSGTDTGDVARGSEHFLE